MDRTIRIDIDGEVLEFELEQPDEMNEDDFWFMVCDYVMSNVNIEVL